MMLKIGLTGNIGSGKSTVCKLFEIMGVPVYYSDNESRRFLSRRDIQSALKVRFGKQIFDGSGKIDREYLGRIVFRDSEALFFLNHLLHPLVMEDYRSWLKKRRNYPYTIFEAAILFEGGVQDEFDKTICVTCPEKIRMKRIIERDGMKEDEIRLRMQHQWAENRKAAASDFIINNNGKELLIPLVASLDSEIRKLKFHKKRSPNHSTGNHDSL